MTTKQAARGKWNGILSQLIGEQAVTRKHGPCPICGGEDRFRYDNKRDNGDWFCNVCGPGDGFRLLQESLGITFAEAARKIDEIVGNCETEEPFKQEIDIEKRREALNKMWASAKDDAVVCGYLKGRGISTDVIASATDLRGSDRLYHRDTGKRYPGMVALIRNNKGVPVSIHRTFLIEGMKEKKIMPSLENISGSCVRLGNPTDTLVLAEGIETALAATVLTGYPAWATISAHSMAVMQSIPRHVQKVVVCVDNDSSFTGQAAGFACAKYMSQKMNLKTTVLMPKTVGFDILDVMCRQGTEELMEWNS